MSFMSHIMEPETANPVDGVELVDLKFVELAGLLLENFREKDAGR